MVKSKENRAVLLILDGLGGVPGESALRKAKKRNMDALAKKGRLGMLYALGKGVVPGSDTSHLSILGYDLTYYPGRGPIEALGAGVKLKRGDVAFRANLAKVKRGKVIDRRAGRITTEEAKKIESLIRKKRIGNLTFEFISTVDHRGVVVVRGGASDKVSDTDPHEVGVEPKKCIPLVPSAKRTANAINKYIEWVAGKLKGKKANMVLLRGAGKYRNLPSFKEKHGIDASFIAGGAMYKGVARLVGIEAPDVAGATGNDKTNLKAKGKAAIDSGKELVFIHVKATDNFGHDGNIAKKSSMIEKIDRELIPMLVRSFNIVCITGDHATPCLLKRHSGHGAPFLAFGKPVGRDKTSKFEEVEASSGSLGDLRGEDVINLIKDWLGKAKKVGS